MVAQLWACPKNLILQTNIARLQFVGKAFRYEQMINLMFDRTSGMSKCWRQFPL